MTTRKDTWPQDNLPKPEIVLLPDDPQWDETDLMPVSDPLSLNVVVPAWEHIPLHPDATTVLILYWTTAATDYPLETRTWDYDDHPAGEIPLAERTFTVPLARLVEGTHEVWYHLNDSYGHLNDSDRTPVTIDLTAPTLGTDSGRLIFDTDTIDQQYLIDNGDAVQAQVPPYTEFKPGDVITWYWSSVPSDPVAADEVGSLTLPRGTTQPLTLVYPGDTIRDRLDGQRFARYRLRDRAGNPSPFSAPVELKVEVESSGRYLPSPTVAEAVGSATSSSLDMANARTGVTVVIPPEALLKPGDVLEVQWAAPGTYGEYVTDESDDSAKRFSIPVRYIPQHMGTHIEVYYRASNGGLPEESQKHDLTVQKKTSGWITIQCTFPRIDLNKLSLASATPHATFKLDKWSFMGLDQRVTITLGGLGPEQVVLDKHPVVQDDIDALGVSVDVANSVLASRPLGALDVLVKVSFDGGKTYVAFPTLKLILVA